MMRLMALGMRSIWSRLLTWRPSGGPLNRGRPAVETGRMASVGVLLFRPVRPSSLPASIDARQR